ncbi:hypothetical protein BGZ95_003406 [Linnemannia exigua]|uniref:Uncharacterized protein n=1 Tax=Linnemannia exigua TaxID=604196 RepID=A0AAD4H8A4_9FUNG|nr:hypothetical protein BGZ95_003406 [Linnemannia exigua]
MPCSAPCDRLPCDERCDKKLPCGHQCPSVCGERCPSIEFCPDCCEPSDTAKIYGLPGIRHLFEVDASKDLILVPPCGHTLTMDMLDELMGLDMYRHEQKEEEEEEWGYVSFDTLKDVSDCPISHIACKVCLKPIGPSFFRYGHSVKQRHLLDVMNEFYNTPCKETIVVDKQQWLDAIDSLVTAKDTLLQVLSKVKAAPRPVQPQSSDKRVKLQDGVLVGDLSEIASLYHIPWRHQAAWTSAIEPAKYALALLGQSFAEQSPLKEIATILINQSRVSDQDTFSKLEDTCTSPLQAAQNSSTATTKEEMVQALQILGLDNVVGADTGVKQSQQLDPRLCSLIMMSVYNLAFDAMKVAGADSGWYWFVGDLLECCQEYNHRFKTMVYDRCDQPASANQLVLEGFCLKMYWLMARPLAGKSSTNEFKQVVQEVVQAVCAEVSELRCDGSGGGLRAEHEAMVIRVEKVVEELLQKVTQQDDEAWYSALHYEKEW